ncbi:RNA polymerase sigma factor [Fulvivirgaceae bacterium BMA10]|uniref:RNA polymerase sigma factor n=1 Tax=Splendidivirga corallicola TaxID=3051826 RepID=A0ABT8KR33_9BACT|nr:RNA polymerase sigma factor [Fulvivirgaceae bacterium BMA10]
MGYFNKKYTLETFSPSEIWDKIREGDHLAFTHIYNLYFYDLCRYGSRICGDRELIEDSIQDLFVEIWRSRKQHPQVHSLKYYLFKRLKRKIIKKLIDDRKAPIDRNILEDYDFKIVFSHEAELISQQITKEQQTKLLKALNQLTRRQKEAITLRFFDGFSNEEVASLLAMNTKSVRNLIYRAMVVLKKHVPKSLVLLLVALLTK